MSAQERDALVIGIVLLTTPLWLFALLRFVWRREIARDKMREELERGRIVPRATIRRGL